MSQNSTIEWTEATWNPVTGCDWVSPGCDHCYARTLAKRMKAMGNVRYQNDGYDKALKQVTPGFGVTLHEDKLGEPLRWKKPRVVFVNSMSDLFHPDVPDSFIAKVFGVMDAAHRHTYQVLTKRPRRAAQLLSDPEFRKGVRSAAPYFTTQADMPFDDEWPLPNVWLGTSVENQEWADKRIPLLLETPAAIRFLSCEPLLGPVDLRRLEARRVWMDCLGGDVTHPGTGDIYTSTPNVIDWVIVGGESGANHRPMNPDWVRSLRDQCANTRVSFFFKQHGGRTPKANGRELDGRTWDEMPERVA